MHWNEILARACACALCAVIITCGCMGSDEQGSSGAATDYSAPAGNMSGGQPPSGGGPNDPPAGNMSGEQPPSDFPGGNMTGERPEMTMEALEAQVAEIEALGFDLPEVRAAMDDGDQAAAQEAFMAFLMEHRDELPEGVGGPAQVEGA